MMFEIEKNIPIPDLLLGRKNIYPFSDMRMGDSFLVPVNKVGGVRFAAYAHGKKHKKRFTVQRVADGYRVWRVK